MIVAFKNRSIAETAANRLIGFWTDSPWVHCEMILLNPYPCAISARTEQDGVTAEPIATVLVQPDRWEYYAVDMGSADAHWPFLLAQVGKSFNYAGLIAGQVIGNSISRPDSWFCSELTYSVLAQFSTLPLPIVEPASVNPARLRQFLIDAGCQSFNFTLTN
ncbi:hypothetical protein GCM10027578_22390 [Spirosoma luteolum]